MKQILSHCAAAATYFEAETLAAFATASAIDTPPKTSIERYACSKCEGSGKTPARRDQRRKVKCQTCHGTGSHTMLVWTDFDWETHR